VEHHTPTSTGSTAVMSAMKAIIAMAVGADPTSGMDGIPLLQSNQPIGVMNMATSSASFPSALNIRMASGYRQSAGGFIFPDPKAPVRAVERRSTNGLFEAPRIGLG
jgi:hypothetical protein